jgi:protein N-terminal methyltransferase
MSATGASSSGAAAASSSSSVQAATKPIHGHDTDGAEYDAVEQMWEKELVGDVNDKQTGWYGKAISYWEKVPPTVDGVLGGLSEVHEDDVKESSAFIKSISSVGRVRSLDCGAGIGRLSRTLLIPLGFETVDLLEPVQHMLEQAKREVDASKAGRFILASMQDPAAFEPKPTYDVIVIQWAAIYLTDADFASFLARCKAALNPGGVIFFKENLSTGQHFVVDKDDSSLTRSDAHYKQIFAAGGVTLVKEKLQKAWPKNLFPVKMYALQ